MGILLSRSHGVRPSAAHFLPEALNGIYRKDGTQPRFQTDVMVITVALLVVLVQLLQMLGDRLVLRFSRR